MRFMFALPSRKAANDLFMALYHRRGWNREDTIYTLISGTVVEVILSIGFTSPAELLRHVAEEMDTIKEVTLG